MGRRRVVGTLFSVIVAAVAVLIGTEVQCDAEMRRIRAAGENVTGIDARIALSREIVNVCSWDERVYLYGTIRVFFGGISLRARMHARLASQLTQLALDAPVDFGTHAARDAEVLWHYRHAMARSGEGTTGGGEPPTGATEDHSAGVCASLRFAVPDSRPSSGIRSSFVCG